MRNEMPTNERRKPTWYMVVLQGLVPALILAVTCWVASTVHDTKVQLAEHRVTTKAEFAIVRSEIASVKSELEEHNRDSKTMSMRNAIDHHRERMTPCNRCHAIIR